MEESNCDREKEYKEAIVGELSKMFEQRGFISHESKTRKILFNEISLLIAIIGVVSTAIFWVTNPHQELELKVAQLQERVESNKSVATALAEIKNNDLNEFQLRLDRIEARQIEEMKTMSRLEALLLKK